MTEQADRIRKRRKAFARPGSSLDRTIRVLAFALPMAVGVIAAMMLITPLSPRGEVSFLLDRNKVAISDQRLRVDNAMYRGQDSKGRPFSLIAGQAVQESNTVPIVALQNLTARIVLPEGPAVLSAAAGQYDIDAEQLRVPGLVQFSAADDYAMSARNVLIDLPTRTLSGDGRVSGELPAGTFEADSIRADLTARTLRLSGDARLRMVPGQLRMPASLR